VSDWEVHELMVSRIASEMDASGVTLLGSFTPLAYASYMLAKLTHAPDAWLFGFNAVGCEPVELSFTGAEAALYRSAVGRWSFPQTINVVHLAKRGLLECVSSAQIDGRGAINLSAIGDYDQPKVRLPGGAGAPEVVHNYRKVVAYVGRHDTRTLVRKVDFATGLRTPLADEARQRLGLQPGPVLLVTPLAVLRKDDDERPFLVESLHPGVAARDVVERTGFELEVPENVPRTAEPTDHQLQLLRQDIDPFGTVKFDFLTGRERLDYLEGILAKEWARAEGSLLGRHV
jgi:acyl CoA:acetate/3-ketoacid CoA transferase beta subunit